MHITSKMRLGESGNFYHRLNWRSAPPSMNLSNISAKQIQKYKNTNNFILHRIKNNKTLAKSHFSIGEYAQYNTNIYNKINLKHYTYYIDIFDIPMLLTLF